MTGAERRIWPERRGGGRAGAAGAVPKAVCTASQCVSAPQDGALFRGHAVRDVVSPPLDRALRLPGPRLRLQNLLVHYAGMSYS